MRIKELRAHGFKSFADGIRLEVNEGVTAVVGPNGCGKSNIVDAIRWVMGELSARHLRGHVMEDVIFGGSEYRKPMSRSEVAIQLTDIAQSLPDPYRGFTELEISRRLYRTGESEYLINNVPCRRRDIADIFLESGVGTRTISIIEQGQVGRVIEASPLERRFFIEQAAGILKYKTRREAALRKLDATKQNLLRVKDILAELTRQRTQLEHQAQKAQRYKEIVEQLRAADLSDASARYLAHKSRDGGLRSEIESLSAEKEAHLARLSALEARIAQARLERTERERLLSNAQEALLAAAGRISEIESARKVAAEGVRLHAGAAALAEEEAAKLEGRRSQIAEERGRLTGERARAEAQILELSGKLSAETADVSRLQAQAREAESSREEARSAVLGAASKIETSSNRLAFAQKVQEEQGRRYGRLEVERSQVASQLAELSQTSFGFSQLLEGSKTNLENLREDLRLAEERLADSRSQIETTRAELRAAKENLSANAARLSSLREIERRYEGYGAGVQAIMLEAERRMAQEGRNGIYGLVADVIRTRPEYERAVESMLGERLQYVVVKSHNEGVEAVEFLKRESKGRGSFVPLTMSPEPLSAATAAGEGVIASLRDVVTVKEGYHAVADYLLGDALLVDRLDRAVHLWEDDGTHCTLVTLEGDVVDRSGVITGGTAEGAGAGVLQKKREIGELSAAVEAAGEAVRHLSSRESQEAALVAAREGELEQLRIRLHRVEIDIAGHEKDVERVGEETVQVGRRREVVEAELAEVRAELSRLSAEIEAAKQERVVLEASHAEAGRALAAAAARLEGREKELGEAAARLGETRVAAAALRERAEALAAELARMDASLAETEAQHVEKIARAAAERADVSRLEGELAAGEGALTESLSARAQAEARQAEVRELFETGEQALVALERDLSARRSGMDQIGRRLSESQIQLREAELQIQRIADEIRERYELELAAHVEALDEAERARLTNEEIRAELHEEAERQRRRLKAVGSVNLDAIQEYDQLAERERFLQAQHDDLDRSVSDLEKAIAKINRTTRERFRATFQAVDSRFREVFPKLFQGGRARLQLTDEANLLESGVEIIAQPPGKKLQDMNMLSGGEKALTAVALLLSIYLIRPAPFVILDEVDAPLDDVNVGRFGEVIRQMVQHSQVIVITHNKQTMQIAQTLVGVTMEEPGVSKLVSVDIH